MNINLGSITLDKPKLIKQLRQDLKDDWFPDPLRYSDIFVLSY
jgi:hypothetical protein